MKELRTKIAALLLWLVFGFSLGYLGQPRYQLSGLASMVVALVVVAVLVPRASRRIPATAVGLIGIVLYLLVRTSRHGLAILWDGHPAALAEVALIGGAIILAQQVGQSLGTIERDVMRFVMGTDPVDRRVHREGEQADWLAEEMLRARRYERPLTVTVVEYDPVDAMTLPKVVQEIQRNAANRYLRTMVARTLARNLRRTDIVLENETRNRLVIVSPETRPGQLGATTRRLGVVLRSDLGIAPRFGSAGFPDHALTYEEMLKQARERAMAEPTIEGRDAGLLAAERAPAPDSRAGGNDREQPDNRHAQLPSLPAVRETDHLVGRTGD